ncbi:MAG TPA: hypothetical protein VMU93_05935 [Caulobacteraceae bacterium]|nr:hypothetical protein [Caulobacteraceae bacterium]
MTKSFRGLIIGAVAAMLMLGSGAEARVHHVVHRHVVHRHVVHRHVVHRHVVHHRDRRRHVVATRRHRYRRIYRHESARRSLERRHEHRHVHAVRRDAAGVCKSVRLHGEWVQRCHFGG